MPMPPPRAYPNQETDSVTHPSDEPDEVASVSSILLGVSQPFEQMKLRLAVAARAKRTTLLLGATGTGKDELARALHATSDRRARSFIPVHCGALPDNLVESEMFGHSRGAFTGAAGDRAGLVRSAKGGTLFLDEVDSLPLGAQAKLLRFLEAGEYRAVGSDRVERSDAWVIAATNRNLEQWTDRGLFRRDLMYRLSVITINVPSLAERADDIKLLAEHFLRQCGDRARSFSADSLATMLGYEWPGNIRELKHRVEAAALFSESDSIGPESLGLPAARSRQPVALARAAVPTSPGERPSIQELLWLMVRDERLTMQQVIEHCELALLREAMREESQCRTRAAQRLGIHVRTLFKKLALLRRANHVDAPDLRWHPNSAPNDRSRDS